jgi:hypothetical protein
MVMHNSGSIAQMGEAEYKSIVDSLEGPFYDEAAIKSMEAPLLKVLVELREKLAFEQPGDYNLLESKMELIARQMKNRRISAKSDYKGPVPLRSAALKERYKRKRIPENEQE